MKIGSVTHTHVALMYVKGKADPGIVKEIKERLNDIEIEGILESAYIEEFIQDKTVTPFPTIYNTERPDDAASKLLEGRIIVLVDGTPSSWSFQRYLFTFSNPRRLCTAI